MKDYTDAFKDIPGTTVFDATQSRLGYHLNMFCMALMKAENRAAFKADERAYLQKFPMTDAQREAVLARDYSRMIELGGNIYFLAKIGATDGFSFQNLASQDDRRERGRIPEDDDRRRPPGGGQPQPLGSGALGLDHGQDHRRRHHSHVPAIGAAIDLGKTAGAVLAAGLQRLRVLEALDRRTEARRRDPRLQRPRVRVLARAHSRPSPSAAPTTSRRPTRAGARVRCRWCRGTRSSRGTSRSRRSSTSST